MMQRLCKLGALTMNNNFMSSHLLKQVGYTSPLLYNSSSNLSSRNLSQLGQQLPNETPHDEKDASTQGVQGEITDSEMAHDEKDASMQGVQGEITDSELVHDPNFKLWLANCQRLGLDDCENKVRDIIKKQQKSNSENDLSNRLVPQGIQYDNSENYEVWVRNCPDFGFGDCNPKLEDIQGKRTLMQVFNEQDNMIRSVASNVPGVHPNYEKEKAPSQSKSDNDSVEETNKDPPVLTQTERLKRAVKDYGATVIVFHVGISLLSYGGCYALVSSGVDLVAILSKLGVSESILGSRAIAGASTAVVAYAVHKVFAPLRILMTLSCAPFIVRFLRRNNFIKQKSIDP